MRVLFIGTSEFAIPAIMAIAADEDFELVGLLTQPDKPSGRGQKMSAPPVCVIAQAANVPIFQPTNLRDETLLNELRALKPDVMAVAAYGRMLPKEILEMAPYKCVNIHPSLLPKLRGAAPIHWAIINGEKTTGITTQFLVEEMDAGDILMQVEVPIAPTETALDLFNRTRIIGADLLLQTLEGLRNGSVKPRQQNHADATFARMLKKEDGLIDWSKSNQEIANQVRGMHAWPGAFTNLREKTLKVFCAEIPEEQTVPANSKPGEIVSVTRSLHVATGDGKICLTDLQLSGKKRMLSQDFIRGYQVKEGELLK